MRGHCWEKRRNQVILTNCHWMKRVEPLSRTSCHPACTCFKGCGSLKCPVAAARPGHHSTQPNLLRRASNPKPTAVKLPSIESCTDCCSHFLSAEFVSSTQEWPVIFPWPGNWGYAVASFEGLWVSSLDRTVSVRSALAQHAPGCYGNYLPSQNVPEHCSELPGAPAWIGCRKPQFTSS